MGLAPYGDPDSKQVAEFVKKIKHNLIKIMPMVLFGLTRVILIMHRLRMINEGKWEQLFGVKQEHRKLKLKWCIAISR